MNANMYVDPITGAGGRRSLWKIPALVAALFVTLLVLASHFTEDWNWPPRAFVVVGALVFGLGFTYELITRNRNAIAYRAAVVIAFMAGFALMWGNFVQMADLTPFAAMYFGVPILGLIGAAVARLRPKGMAMALFVTAVAQVLVLVAMAIVLWNRTPELSSWTAPVWRGLAGNTMNALMFFASALLFRRAGRRETWAAN